MSTQPVPRSAATRLPSKATATASALAAAFAWVLLLVRWFVAPGVAGSPRSAPVWPFVLLFIAVAAAAAISGRRRLAAMRGELAATLRLSRGERAMVGLALLASFLFQLPTMLFPAGLLHSDASINGLMALHIAEGRVPPAFYYGQEYMGTLFSHVLGLLFVLTGPFVGGMQLVTWLFWALFLLGTFFLVRRASDAPVALAVTLWLALPPPLLIITLAQSEYAELLPLAVWALLIVAAASAGPLRSPGWWIVAGILLGVAFWCHPMAAIVIVVALASAALSQPLLAAARCLPRVAVGLLLGLAPALVGWGARLGHFLEWFLHGGGRGGEATLLRAGVGISRVSLGNLLLGTDGRAPLPLGVAALLPAVVVASACTTVWWGWRSRSAAEAVGGDGTSAFGERARAAAGLPLGLFVLLQLVVLLGRRYAVVPTQYIVPLYLGLPAVVAIAVDGWARTRLRRHSFVTATVVLAWAALSLPASIDWLRTLPGNQESMNASIAALRGAGVEACFGPYWDAYRLSYLTLEDIVCESIDVRRVPGYRERVAARSVGPAPFVAAPQRRTALEAHRRSLDSRGIPWVYLRTARFEALLPER